MDLIGMERCTPIQYLALWIRTDKVFYFYRASESGALYANQWYSGEDAINYYGENAKICTGLQTVNGIQYLFDSKGALISSRIVLVDDTNYYCDTNGVAHKMPNNQWYKSDDGAWYYVEKGILNWNYNGLVEYYGTLYYIQNGYLNWGYSGRIWYNGKWYKIVNGVAQKD